MSARPAPISRVRRRRERSTTTSVSELSKADVSRFILTSFALFANPDCGLAALYYANKSVAATDRVRFRLPPLIFDQRRHLLCKGALAQTAVYRALALGGRKGEAEMESYGILGWIVIGGLAGALAKLLMPGRDPGGCIITILLGIAGALLAGFIGRSVGWYTEGEGAGFIAAIVGAFVILLIYRLVLARRR